MPFDQADMEDVNNLIKEIDKGSYSLAEAKSKLSKIEKEWKKDSNLTKLIESQYFVDVEDDQKTHRVNI